MMRRLALGAVGLLTITGVLLAARGAAERRTARPLPRPEAARPAPERPTARYLELQAGAQRQPSGTLNPDAAQVVPAVANPAR